MKIETDERSAAKLSIDDILQKAAEMLAIEVEVLHLNIRVKEFVDARAALCYLAAREYNNGVEIAGAMNITPRGVSVAALMKLTIE